MRGVPGGEDLARVGAHRDLAERLLHAPIGADDVGDALGGARAGVVRGAERDAELARRVREQRERVFELLGEGLVLLGRVEADAEDLDAPGLVLLVEVAEPATLDRSTGGVGLGIEPEDERPSAQLGQRDFLARVRDHFEIRDRVADVEHGGSLRPRRAPVKPVLSPVEGPKCRLRAAGRLRYGYAPLSRV